MEMLKNFSETFLSVWNKGILGVDIFQILIGIGIFLIFLIFRGLISKLIIKKLEVISKRTTNKLDDTFVSSLVGPAGPTSELTNVSSNLFVVLFEITSNFLIINLLIKPLKIRNIKKIPIPINI